MHQLHLLWSRISRMNRIYGTDSDPMWCYRDRSREEGACNDSEAGCNGCSRVEIPASVEDA